jgi:hypothetical protein
MASMFVRRKYAHSAKYFSGCDQEEKGGALGGASWGRGVPLVAQLGEALFAKWAGQIGAKREHLDSKPLLRHICFHSVQILRGNAPFCHAP